MATFTFEGTIVNVLGEPQSGKLVTVYRKTTLRDYDTRQPTATSDPSGKYVIGFTWTDVEAGDFEIVVTQSGSGEIGRSVVLLDLEGGKHQVDIVTGGESYRGRSEFRRIEVAVQPLAFDGATPIPYEDLALDDVDYLANKAKYPASVIATFIHAHRLAALLSNSVPADAFFGMLREGLSPEFAELLAQGPEVQRAALDRAVARNLFDDPGTAALDGYIVALDSAAIDSAVWFDVASGDKSKFRQMIDAADRGGGEGAESVQRAFLAKYAAHTGDLDSFWAAVIADVNLGQNVHDTYKWCLQVQAVCNGHQPLIDALQAKRNDVQDPVNTFADLATIDVEGWKTLINNGIGVPDSIPQDWVESDRVQRYAETIARLVSDAVPTRVVHERIKRDSLEISGAADLDTFFTNNPSFDLREAVFQRYLGTNPTALDAVPTTDGRRDACAANIKAIQRLSYVAPRGSTYDTIKPLYLAGIRSAADIDAMGPVAFVRRFAASFGEGEVGKIRARAVYDRASHVYSITLALLSKYGPAFNKVNPTVHNSSVVPNSAPDLEALFGSMDFCGCEHCRSVFSPAAYMVDVLQFLRQQPGTGSNDALTDLQARRPDITKIDLSCANASTPLPYIDLVNELLETRVSNGLAPGDDYWQTTWTAEELALRPEHRDDGAYVELVAAAYPWNLPFDLHRTEADIYLDELEAPRHAILEAFNPAPDADVLARARLGLSPAMAAAITGGVGFTTLDSWNGQNAAALNSVALVLETSRQTFDELKTIVATEFVGSDLTLSFAQFPNDCDLSLASIILDPPSDPENPDPFTDAHLERWHRFVRLQRALGWSAYQLDSAIRALAPTPTSLDTAFLRNLGAAQVIGKRLGLEGLDLFGLWADIDTATPPEDPNAPSRYASLFLRRTLVDDPDNSVFALNSSGELATTTEPMNHDSRLAVVMAALRASSVEIGELVDWLVTDLDMTAVTTTTTVAILSAARRRVSLARALRVSLVVLRRLVAVTGINPFHDSATVVDMAGLQSTIDFLDAAQVVLDSKFSVEALGYILFHSEPSTAGIKPDPVASLALLTTLDAQLAGVAERYAVVDDPTSSRLRDALAEYLPPTDPADLVNDAKRLDDLMAIILGTSSESETEQNNLISTEMDGFLTDIQATQAALVGGLQLTDRNARILHVLELLLPWLEARARRAVTIQTLSEGLGLTIEIGEQLLVEYMQSGASPLVETFEAGGNIDNGNLVAASETAFVRLYKAGALVLGFGFDAADLTYLYGLDAPALAPWLDVNDLAASGPTGPSFESWKRLASVARARARFPEHHDTLEVLRAVANVSDVDTILAERGGWLATDVSQIRTQLGLAALTDFDDEAAFLTILDTLELVERTGLSASMLISMATTEATSAQADALRHSLRSRHGDATWATTGKALRDPLREQQRQALVAYLLANGDDGVSFSTENDLYAHYLLDVEMSACATTSRIRLALSSIQLFIQRVFLNLEDPIQFDADAALQYKWMKNYRVWEANRKVFLYPENFVQPELRTDKSPLFAELEAALAQDEPSSKLTEKAFLGYLKGLESIAKPEVMGLVNERVSGSGDALIERLHVIARTRGEPHRWLYRTREDQRYWTPWVGLDADIEGDHVLPAVFNGRLYVLWPSFQLAGEEISQVEPDDEGAAGGGHVEIRLNWVERRFGEWGPVRMSAPFKTPTTIDRWGLPAYQRNIRLSTRVVQSTSSGRPALDVAVRQFFSLFEIDGDPVGQLMVIGRFVLEATDDAFVAQAVPPDGEIEKWSFELNDHVVRGQALVATSTAPSKLQLETVEARWPSRRQTQTLFASPPRGYALMFAQTDQPGLVRSTGFFYQDRWRSLFIEPRDIHAARVGTLNDVDPADIEAAPFIEQAGLKIEPPIVNLEPKVIDIAPQVLTLDNLQVKSPTYIGLAGVVTAKAVAINQIAEQQVISLAHQETDNATKVYDTEATPKAKRSSLPWAGKRYRAYMFEHPYTDVFVGEIRAGGVEGLLAPVEGQSVDGLARQQLTETVLSEERYAPKLFDNPLPEADIDFSVGGAYSIYNWELFFHAPVLLAKRLTSSHRFEEADWWLRKVFDPTASDGAAPARYWRIKPFFESAQSPSIHELLLLLQYDGTDGEQLEAREAFEAQIWHWRRNPFEPHLIAGFRDGTYQRAVVMQYLDNLIAWGDSLFGQDSIESINEATQLYIMAQNILGPRPVMIDPHGEPVPKNFEELENGGLDAFGNAIVELENYTLGSLAHSGLMEQDANSGLGTSVNSARVPHTWYFCVPSNDKLLGYWDTVEDRLTKIRNCQNLQGIERKLALFEPPIDPKALVSAAALGGDFGSALAAVSGRAPKHRFRVLLAKSLELAGEVRNLGNTLLRALEGRDTAKLAQLRASQEPALLQRVRASLELRIRYAEQTIATLEAAKETVEARQEEYRYRLSANKDIADDSKTTDRSEEEQHQLKFLRDAESDARAASDWQDLVRTVALIPNIQLGIQGVGSSPVATFTWGSTQIASYMSAQAGLYQQRASVHGLEAQAAGLSASFDRRYEDWVLQVALASRELEHIEAQKVAALTQVEIAKAELAAHDKRVADAEAVDAFMRTRYTNEQLYVWMEQQIKQVYKQAYNLAFRMALAAEQAYRFELQRNDSFIGYQYWDQAHAGLLAGDLLVQDLHRMDAAYIDNYEREYELTKVVSLAQVDPYALATLRQTGSCYFTVPEWVYDLDHPGHIRRRIKSVSIAMPAVAGPHVGGGCTLTLESSKMRILTGGGDYTEAADDSRFVYRYGQVERIATSSGRDSTGMFEPSLEGPRYMPFEGAGAISTWRVNLPADFRQFDYESIGDVLLTIRYTAREGGSAQAQAALDNLDSISADHAYGSQPGATGAAMMLRASVDFADAWYAFLREEHGDATRTFTMELDPSRFPYTFAKRANLEITALRFVLVTSAPAAMDASISLPSGAVEADFATNSSLGGHMLASWTDTESPEAPGTFTLSVTETAIINAGLDVTYDTTHTRFDETKVRELIVVVFFKDSTP